jgi:hypothetical protein
MKEAGRVSVAVMIVTLIIGEQFLLEIAIFSKLYDDMVKVSIGI